MAEFSHKITQRIRQIAIWLAEQNGSDEPDTPENIAKYWDKAAETFKDSIRSSESG
jgi:hypothetical protein